MNPFCTDLFRSCVLFFFPLLIIKSVFSNDVRYACDMTHLPAGSDIAAMGDAGVVLPWKGASSYWNAASASYQKKSEISAEIADLYSGLSEQACFTVHFPLQGTTSASILYIPFLSGDFQLNDTLPGTYQERIFNQDLRADGSYKSLFQDNQQLLVLSVAKLFPLKLPRAPGSGYPLPLDIGIGFNFKGYWQVMNPDEKTRLGMCANLDAGTLIRIGVDYDIVKKEISREILFGISVRDFLPSKVIWVHSPQNYQEPVNSSYYYGLAFADRSGNLGFNYKIALSLNKEYKTTYHGGIETEFWNMVIFRAGFSDRIPTLGAGIHYKRYYLDYAFRFDEIDISYLRLTLGVVF